MSRPKCQCRDGCPFAADEGQPFKLAHDPRPEMAEAKRAAASALGKRASVKRAENREAARRRKCSLRTVVDLLAELERALLCAESSGGDKLKRAAVVAGIVSKAHDILHADTERSADRLAKLLADNPKLAERLQVVK